MARNLSIGVSGQDVKDLQRSLNSHPATALAPLAADGSFGPKTAARVKEYQKNNGLTVDGIVGPNTRAALGGQVPAVDRGANCCSGESFVQAQTGMIAALFKAQQFPVGKTFASSGNQFGFVGAAGAAVASAAAAVDDPFVILNKDFPAFWPFDAYAYHPSLPFANLAAEQMASAIEHKEPAIISHIQAIAMNALDSSLVTALSKPGFADRRLKGVK
jgi:Putative peptidoglycan binding domain